MDKGKKISRRSFLKRMGLGTAATVLAVSGCDNANPLPETATDRNGIPGGKMTCRTTVNTGDKVSILGYGAMRLPTISNQSGRESEDTIDQDEVNRHVDYAIAHGVNYFDTSPAYCKGRSEHALGIALSRHTRSEFFVATKLSNFAPATWSRENGIKMYHNSLKELQTNYIDYMLLHAIGQPTTDLSERQLDGMQAFEERYIKNGILDFLLQERKAGRIRNLGFSYHGDVKVFDYLLSQNDKYHWDFVQIQMNYVDWHHAKEINERNTNADYLYGELASRNIPVVIMEPLLGGQLANLPDFLVAKLKQRRPDDSVASWAFRFAGTHERVLTVLSGMTYMEHLQENIKTYSPLQPCSAEELEILEEAAKIFLQYPTVPCTGCQYCMPCPYGLNIPEIFAHYNKCVNEGYVSASSQDENYRRNRKIFLVGYDRKVPAERQANHCIGCGKCMSHCPQGIDIPSNMQKIDAYVEKLKQETEF